LKNQALSSIEFECELGIVSVCGGAPLFQGGAPFAANRLMPLGEYPNLCNTSSVSAPITPAGFPISAGVAENAIGERMGYLPHARMLDCLEQVHGVEMRIVKQGFETQDGRDWNTGRS